MLGKVRAYGSARALYFHLLRAGGIGQGCHVKRSAYILSGVFAGGWRLESRRCSEFVGDTILLLTFLCHIISALRILDSS